ncbi:hypothetical protein VOLCADRAFT_102758 [Volvox carteri f. nagariensis]|uniref:Archease domain-containing protein n=1 Tax=Volvox carteri f. nagariensis TaxID=3068 RepID=D8THW5_VOLCA|nr:uncharacterized protein VOLCADRAFT_102758 [Volvox carteri f. nagariensis]EFJ53137.1 hypothetical protein VOLCADRAFT_102758 [Volvox carteri f. nagariensis]|eukprot:XP_002946142.1 hypothetical protein VOLCADRAFT_102758 [Volvox carteri f. nagariensis]
MDENALPQRPNARQRMRAQRAAEAEAATSSDQTTCATTTACSGRRLIPVSEPNAICVSPDQGTAMGDAAEPDYIPTSSLRSQGRTPDGDEDVPNPLLLPLQYPPAGPGEAGNEAADGGGGNLPPYRSAAVGTYKFEYLDHTADVQLHAWGNNLTEAFENCALAMFNYMSPLEHVRPRETRSYRAEGHDLPSLLFSFLDELLFVFATELFLAVEVHIQSFDRTSFVIEAEGVGEAFNRDIHEVGTEIKAITYSAMSIKERENDAELFVIVDI